MNGPGKYDHLCTIVREITEARIAVVIVVGGNKGHGFEMQHSAENLEEAKTDLRYFVGSLRDMADVIEKDIENIRFEPEKEPPCQTPSSES